MLLFKVFTRAEIALICNLCVAHNVVVIADEVYEHMVSAMNPFYRESLKGSCQVARICGGKIAFSCLHPAVS